MKALTLTAVTLVLGGLSLVAQQAQLTLAQMEANKKVVRGETSL